MSQSIGNLCQKKTADGLTVLCLESAIVRVSPVGGKLQHAVGGGEETRLRLGSQKTAAVAAEEADGQDAARPDALFQCRVEFIDNRRLERWVRAAYQAVRSSRWQYRRLTDVPSSVENSARW